MYERYNRGRIRGRPRGRFNLYEDLRSIVNIAGRYDLDPKLLVSAFIEAWKNQVAYCDELMIRCRSVTKDSAMLLITNEEKVVSQLPIKLELLRNPDYYMR